MKKNKFLTRFQYAVAGTLLLGAAATGFVSCSEEVDSSNFSVSTQNSMAEFINNTDSLSDLKAILSRVRLGNVEGASSILSVISTRGNYTVFAPTNSAIQQYCQSVGVNSVADLTYEQAEKVAKSCVIDNGVTKAYQTTEFPQNGSFDLPTLNARTLSCVETVDSTSAASSTYFLINGNARVVLADQEVSNGFLHIVNQVIAPSSSLVTQLLEKADNMVLANKLYEVTGLSGQLTAERDSVYEKNTHTLTYKLSTSDNTVFTQAAVQHRLKGYTLFVETDDVLSNWLGVPVQKNGTTITNWDQIKDRLLEKCKEAYPEATDDGDLTSKNNAINKFLSYHVVQGRLSSFVRHYAEYGYDFGSDRMNPQENIFPVDVWDYYTTIDNRLVKLSQASGGAADEKPFYINRVTKHNYEMNGDGKETTVVYPGAKISMTNGNFDNNGMNGFYYPIDQVLLANDEATSALSSERIRFDITTILPEFYSNGLRSYRTPYTVFEDGYFDNIKLNSSSTNILFLNEAHSGVGYGWKDYQGDEFIFDGAYDFVLKLPPVPKDGQYELRMGVSINSVRGMAQIYFGDDWNNLAPIGLPLDMRISGSNDVIGWKSDESFENDFTAITENDRMLRTHGYMKGPKYYKIAGSGNTLFRNSDDVLRRIITNAYMQAGKSYYLRFKSSLRSLSGQFFVDYFEYAPRSVYNGETAEDIW